MMYGTCPRFKKQQKDHDNKIYQDNRDLFQYISKNSGMNISTMQQLYYVYDVLKFEASLNLPLPEWTKTIFPGGKFKEVYNLNFVELSFNDEVKRLKGGSFLKEIIS